MADEVKTTLFILGGDAQPNCCLDNQQNNSGTDSNKSISNPVQP